MSIRTRFNPLGTIGRKSLLPAGYIELEYLEGTGTQYIDTGIVPDRYTKWQLDSLSIRPKSSSGRHGTVWNATTPITRFEIAINTAGDASDLLAGGSLGGDYVMTETLSTERIVYVLDATNETLTVKGVSYQTPYAYDAPLSLALFARHSKYGNSNPVFDCYCICKVYSSKIWKNGKVVRNFVPALDPTGRPCMFDLVHRKPYYNQGTGEFKCGYKLPRGYEQVDFVTFDGATALDTGMHIATPCWFWCDFQPTIYHQDNVLIGYRIDKAQDTRIGFGMSNGTNNAVYFGRGKTFPLPNYRVAMGLDRHTVECRMSLSDVYTAFDGGQLTRVPENQCQAGFNRAVALSSSSHIYIGAAHDGNETQLYWTGKVFGLKFKGENGNVVANIIPARYNGQPCMYDVVRGIKLATVQGNLQ